MPRRPAGSAAVARDFGGRRAALRLAAPGSGAPRAAAVAGRLIVPSRRSRGVSWGGPLAAAALLLACVVPSACGESREAARLGALEAGIASAQASLAALSAAAPSAAAPPVPRLSPASVSPSRPAAGPAPRPLVPAGATPPLAASDLLGAEPEALRRWFGEPDLRRAEGDAEVLLFLGSGCALDLVLYAEGGAKRVAHAAARADGPAAVTEADCLRGIGGGEGIGRAAAPGHTPPR